MKNDNITIESLARMFDHTFLKPFATYSDFRHICKEALKYNFTMVAINSYPVKFCKNILKSSSVMLEQLYFPRLEQRLSISNCFK